MIDPSMEKESLQELEPGRELDTKRQRHQEVQMGDMEPEGGGWGAGDRRIIEFPAKSRGSGQASRIGLSLVILAAIAFAVFPVLLAVGLLSQVAVLNGGNMGTGMIILWSIIAGLLALGAAFFSFSFVKRSL